MHHLDCGPLRPIGGALMDGISPGLIGHLPCHCLAIETDAHGLVLVDTGLGVRDIARPTQRLPWPNAAGLRPLLDPARTMLRQLKALGHSPRDVTHIVMTHLDFDHAGGLIDFPKARVHLLEREAAAATARRGLQGRIRYRPAQWGDTRRWHAYAAGERWFGFEAVSGLVGLPPEILFVPLPGHTPGHAGVAIDGPRGWVLHAGDSYFNRAEMYARPPVAPAGAAAYEWLLAWDVAIARRNRARLRQLVRGTDGPAAVFCTHDPVELAAMTAWTERVPARIPSAAVLA